MTMTDPIADLLTRLRNAHTAKHETTIVPLSKIKLEIVRVLKEEGYIENYEILQAPDDVQGAIKIKLRYIKYNSGVVRKLIRISKPGKRQYANLKNMPRVMRGLGVAILSTSKGILTDRQARREKVGGEILCYVW
ncbi:MAG: 30S ribosomal protein S8 [bacterium]|nr:30S ribosomal protein S8 [bacterium]